MLSAGTAAAILVWSTAGAVGSALFLYGTPMLEARLAPVLSEQRVEVDDSDRSPGRIVLDMVLDEEPLRSTDRCLVVDHHRRHIGRVPRHCGEAARRANPASPAG